MSLRKIIRSCSFFGVLMAAALLHTDANAQELPRFGDWRLFQNAQECWTTAHIKGTRQKRTGGNVYISARVARGTREPEISLTIARSFPTGLAIALITDGKNIPLFIAPPQTAFPQNNAFALQNLTTATQATYVSGEKGFEIDTQGFQDAVDQLQTACS